VHSILVCRARWQRRGARGRWRNRDPRPRAVSAHAFFAAAIVVLIWLLDVSATKERHLRSAFSIGWFFGLGHFSTGLYWVA
jgi:apolipoprotein N-acyltransferase